jgi:hypothetical protein
MRLELPRPAFKLFLNIAGQLPQSVNFPHDQSRARHANLPR